MATTAKSDAEYPARSDPSVAISVVIPVFNEAESLPELYDRLTAALEGLAGPDGHEMVFVNDGSTDATRSVLTSLAARDPRVRAIRLRRNSGKSLALMVGFRAVRGRICVQMDADLQDRPEDLAGMIALLESGHDIVNGWRMRRQDTAVRRIGSALYNFAIRKMTGLDLHDMNVGLKVYRREVVDSICVYGQYHRYIPLIASMLGFAVVETPIGNDHRRYGESKFVTFRYQGLFDLISLMFLKKYNLSPLHFFGVASLPLIVGGGLMLCWFFGSQALYWAGFGAEFMVQNRPMLAISIFMTLFGVGVFMCGFVCDFILHHMVRHRISDIIDSIALEEKRPIDAAEKP